MLAWLANVATTCWLHTTCRDLLELDNDDPLVWSRDLERHSCGEYSFAVCQANAILEDFSQVETGTNATFVGIYDGHGGHEAAEFVRNHIFNEILRITRTHNNMAQATLGGAIAHTESGFLQFVRQVRRERPNIVTVGTCCLVGVIWKGTLFIANLGDSRAVLGYVNHERKITAEPLTYDHNVNIEQIRRELLITHTDDPNLVVLNNGVHRVKGIIQVSRAIGDAYLKSNEFKANSSQTRFRLSAPLREQPALSSDPDLYTRAFRNRDQFLIFASDGLWDSLSNQRAVEIVHKYPREGIARRLIKAAQNKAGKKANLPYRAVYNVPRGGRRDIHDDITVVVVYINHELLGNKICSTPKNSIKSFDDNVGESGFATIDDLMG